MWKIYTQADKSKTKKRSVYEKGNVGTQELQHEVTSGRVQVDKQSSANRRETTHALVVLLWKKATNM